MTENQNTTTNNKHLIDFAANSTTRTAEHPHTEKLQERLSTIMRRVEQLERNVAELTTRLQELEH